ncbi:hypothetical protein Pcinc_041001 [Petrolisthes cinctipes]|uniref:Uncharacterized protein n=1 Tax=Petrolisthes cinctipes TaxID=88211 RepID=A0AAE1BKG5_PETCI|nr:hypothetical protein Pcinc_041001 [Petrolisthes cinctipes]
MQGVRYEGGKFVMRGEGKWKGVCDGRYEMMREWGSYLGVGRGVGLQGQQEGWGGHRSQEESGTGGDTTKWSLLLLLPRRRRDCVHRGEVTEQSLRGDTGSRRDYSVVLSQLRQRRRQCCATHIALTCC